MNTEMSDNLDEVLQAMKEWIQYEKEQYIEKNIQVIEQKAAELEITCDYYIAEFLWYK